MRSLGLVAALAVSMATSCGGGDGSCGGAACGGEIAAGRYRISSFCSSITGTVQSPLCPMGTIAVVSSALNVSGTITFNADKTYQSVTTLGGTIVEAFSGECLAKVAGSCAQLNQTFGGRGGSCTGTTVCTCTLRLAPQDGMAMGTYSTSGTTLTITPTGKNGSPGEYCATPTSLTILSSPAMNGALMPGIASMQMGTSTMTLTRE